MIAGYAIVQIIAFLSVILLCIKPLGLYMAKVYEREKTISDYVFGPLEKLIYTICGIDSKSEMNWKHYLSAMLVFNFLGIIFIYILLRFQYYLPFNPQHFKNLSPMLALNTAVSFTTNTNWQNYAGESTLSYFSQTIGLTVQNFLSPATGMSLLIALIRGISRQGTNKIGNYWVDLTRTVLYILVPIACVLSILLLTQGVIQNIKPYQEITLLQSTTTDHMQKIPMGPVASQVAIKQLGTNGGGFFNTNSAHPFENPTPLSNFIEMIAILLIPASLCYVFGVMTKDTRQGWAILFTMLLILIPFFSVTIVSEEIGSPIIHHLSLTSDIDKNIVSASNMEGKEVRIGVIGSALWATITTATASGSVNSMHGAYTPLSGLVILSLMHLGEVVFGGAGSGLYTMLVLVILTVFIAGLMIGRTPEYLGKKIETYDMKMASIAILIMPVIVLTLTGIAVMTNVGRAAVIDHGAHGFSEILYAFTSMTKNNGSALSGLNGNNYFYNIIGALGMLFGRYWVAIAILSLAGSLANKKTIPASAGTLPTHTFSFIILVISITVILGALSFLPVVSLGPIVEHIMLWNQYG